MPFNKPSLETIAARIEADITSRLTGGVALLLKALLKIIGRVVAGASYVMLSSMDYLSRQFFALTADSIHLPIHAEEWKVSRNPAVAATGSVLFTASSSGLTIDAGTIVENDAGVQYSTDAEAVTADGFALANVTAVEPGAAGNMSEGFVFLSQPIAGIDDAAEVLDPIAGGIDEESIEDWRQRILFRKRNPPAGGNDKDYERWAREVSNVRNSFVYPKYLGAGSVAVVVTQKDDDDPVAPAPTITEVEDLIIGDPLGTGYAPTTAAPRVKIFTVTPIWYNLTLTITPDTTELQAAVNQNVKDFFNSSARPGASLLLALLQESILSAGLSNYVISDIEKSSAQGGPYGSISLADIPLAGYPDFEFPILNQITFN